MPTQPKKVCLIAGDGTAPEYFWPTVEVLESLKLGLEWIKPNIDAEESGFEPALEIKQAIDASNATLFGASTKHPNILTYLKWGKGTYANLRPIKYFKGCTTPLSNPEGIDYVIVREHLEGLYPGREGDIKELGSLNVFDAKTGKGIDNSQAGKYALRLITVESTKRVAKYACELALKRKKAGFKGKVTCATKSNMMHQSCGLFRKIVEETVKEYPDLTYEHFFIDDIAYRLIQNPKDLDVVVVSNLFGDILGDLGAGTVGGFGLAARASFGDNFAFFDTVIGAQPSLMGKNIINPSAMLFSAALMLDYLGYVNEAVELEEVIAGLYRDRSCLTPDQGGNASTSEFCKAVKARLE